MNFDMQLLTWAAQQSAGWLAAAGVFLAYRKEHLRKQTMLKESNDRLLSIVERQATASEAQVRLIEQIEERLNEYHKAEIIWIDRLNSNIEGMPGKIRHELAPLFEKVILRYKKEVL